MIDAGSEAQRLQTHFPRGFERARRGDRKTRDEMAESKGDERHMVRIWEAEQEDYEGPTEQGMGKCFVTLKSPVLFSSSQLYTWFHFQCHPFLELE